MAGTKFTYYVKVIQDPNSIAPGMLLKIKDMAEGNDKVIAEVAKFFDTSISKTEEIINFMGSYVRGVIEEGNMETVMLPYFGKYTPNIKLLQAKTKRIRQIQNKSFALELAIRGRNINFIPQINPINHAPKSEPLQEDKEEEPIEDDMGDDSWLLGETDL